MVLCKMKIFGICTVLYLVIYIADVCDAECEEYFVVFEEYICSDGTDYRITPLKKDFINWDNVTYPCNSTLEDPGKEKCLVEFDCLDSVDNCTDHKKDENKQYNYFIVHNQTAKPISIRTEAPDPTTSKITDVTEESHHNNNQTAKPISIRTEAPEVTTSKITDVTEESHHNNQTAKPISIRTEAPDVTTSNITDVTEKPHHTLDEEFTASMYDVNLIYINENDIQNNSETTSKTTRNETLYCDYAETVCFGKMKQENISLRDFQNITYNTDLEEPARILLISIDRDFTSSVQPIFTGYFSESSNDSSKNYNGNFKYLKTMSTTCSLPKHNNCKGNIQINIYIKANYIENNTITKYPNCTKDSITSDNILKVKCEDILFAEHNRHIIQTPSTAPPKQEMWTCQIKGLKYPILYSKGSENNKLYFINCSNETNNNKIKSEDNNITPISDKKNTTIHSILTKDGIEIDKTETFTGGEKLSKDNSSQTNLENMFTILVTENTNNCIHNISLNIAEGKIIDLGVHNNEKILQNNNIELILSNCINDNYFINNDKQPPSNVELTIILKSESLNASNLELLNGTAKDKSLKQRILLRCDHPNHDLSGNATSNKTTLQCESIDLDFYNITGIEITPGNQISNEKITIKPENKTIQELLTWNCQIFEFNDTSKEDQNSKLYFDNCSKELNNSKNKSGDKKVKLIPDDENRNINGNQLNKTENSSGKFELNKDLSQLKPKNMIKILVTEKPNNCSNHSSFTNIIDEGKIIDLGVNENENKFLQNNIVQLKLSSCINVHSSITNETYSDLKVELTIILKNESLNAANLKLFNGTLKDENVKQRILLLCEHPNLVSSSNATSDNTELQCESIDLDLNNITGIEQNVNMVEVIAGNQTEVNMDIHKKGKLITNTTVDNNVSVNNKSHEKNTEVVENKEIQKNISENKEVKKNITQTKEIPTNIIFNRKKDIPTGSSQNGLALGLGSPETEKVMLITLLSMVGTAILMVIAWRMCPKKRKYNAAPTREPPNEEESAF